MIGAGATIGNYRILAKIGTGGMGAVFVAEHPLIGKKVALKVIHRELAGNRDVVSRFFQEARAANAIGNEHIVEIHDFGVTAEGDHFYIMEYLEGRTLASVLAQEPALDPLRALHIGAQIANALGAAHEAGILHRDLKPDNIMLMARLGDPDFVKVLDFGLAKMFAGGGDGAGHVVKTAAGVLLGTPQYMSPEACESKRELDHRTDIYALGILLFQMLTGRLPFEGETMGEVLIAQVRSLPPAPRGINPMIPPAVEQVVLRCLAKAPEDRFQTMGALREALVDPERYLRASPPISPARSVAPGEARVTAAQLQAHVEAQQRAKAAAGAPAAGTGRNPIPGLAPPAAPLNHTMRIATPVGYVSRPTRRMWPLVLVFGLLLGLGGGAVAVVMMNRGGEPEAMAAAVPPDAAQVAAPIDAASAPAPIAVAADAAVADAARVMLSSEPAGAAVHVGTAEVCATTPCEVQWPRTHAPVEFRFALVGYEKRAMSVTVDGTTDVHVQLVKKQRPPSRDPGAARGSAQPDNNSGLMRPE